MIHGAGDMKDDVMGVIMKVIWRCVRERANPRSGEFSSVAQRPLIRVATYQLNLIYVYIYIYIYIYIV